MVLPRIFENFRRSFYDDDVVINRDDLYFWPNGEIKILAEDLRSKLVLKLADGKISTRKLLELKWTHESLPPAWG